MGQIFLIQLSGPPQHSKCTGFSGFHNAQTMSALKTLFEVGSSTT